ncbi:MAG: bifunctional riboflavin kinase/FAD synthetase [Acidimicrobiia bacterium]|nr:bifunctional riboflavin kinase/FAD synthetase [Acidimicrobiia bacterium]
MRVYRGLREAAGAFGPSAVTMGNFDGVHLGHQHLLKRLVEMSRRLKVKASIITFDPHPACVVAPDRAPKLISTIGQRMERMAGHGIEQALVLEFDREFSLQSPGEFVERVLVEGAGAKGVLVGENFRFGNRQAGDTALLRQLGSKHGFEVEIAGPVTLRGRMVSSTEVRRLVQAGQMALAARFLGRHYSVEGPVVGGHGVGSKQTVPTLNLNPAAEVLPARGVYVTRTHDAARGRNWKSVTNVGFRPTFGGDEQINIETFLLEGFEEPSPERIRVEFLHRLRAERKFPDAQALKGQILRDVGRSQTYQRRLKRWTGRGGE